MCDKRLLYIQRSAAQPPPYEGGTGDVDSEGPVVAQKNIANGTSPYPLHKGDLVCARGILVYALRSFAALRMTIAQHAKAGDNE